jgi:hypothetical protein
MISKFKKDIMKNLKLNPVEFKDLIPGKLYGTSDSPEGPIKWFVLFGEKPNKDSKGVYYSFWFNIPSELLPNTNLFKALKIDGLYLVSNDKKNWVKGQYRGVVVQVDGRIERYSYLKEYKEESPFNLLVPTGTKEEQANFLRMTALTLESGPEGH